VGESVFNEDEYEIFTRIIREMPPKRLYEIAGRYEVDFPSELPIFKIPDFLYEELDEEARREIIDEYRDAGNTTCHFFLFDEETPSLSALAGNHNAILALKREEDFFENVPYFERIETHDLTNTLRARFHYYKGRTQLLDRETRTIRELLNVFHGVVIFRPYRKIVEVRAKDRRVSKNAVISSSSALGLEPPSSLNLNREEIIKRFLGWIYSLNNARFEFDITQTISSLSMSARGRRDLRRNEDFIRYLREGRLRGGHVTIKTEEERTIRFRIFFRDCHVYFTSYSNEKDIEIVVDAIEKIVEEYRFEFPYRTIEEYFK